LKLKLRTKRILHEGFLVGAGVLGWWVAAAVAGLPLHWPSLPSAALFLTVVAGARSLAFTLANGAEISLDAAIFIAATACLGTSATVVGLGSLLSLDVLVRALRSRGARRAVPLHLSAAHALFRGGVSAGLLASWARLFGVGFGGDEGAAWRVVAFGLCFLVSHYLVQTLQQRVAGQPLLMSARRNLAGVVAEATLLPLASVIVLIWEPHRPVPFALLAGTYLLVSFGFKRVAQMAAAERRRVIGLEALHRTAHALGTTLETPQLLSALLRETQTALPRASRLEGLVRTSGGLERWVIDLSDATQNGDPRQLPLTSESRALLLSKTPRLEDEPSVNLYGGEVSGQRAVRSRIVAPLVMYGEVTGALMAESPVPDAFGDDELRLLDAISSQAAAAVENARLYALANVDGLTGLYCRRYFDIRIAEEIERARRFGTSFALIMCDLDDFKRLNDSLGHVAGDRALREVAAIAAGQLRGVDLAARYGGEELAFLLPRTSLADAHAVAERIRAAVASYSLVENGQMWPLTLSCGVAGWSESGATDPGALVARADAALYRAKAGGKNRVEIDLANFELTPSLAPVRRRRS
jgi:diguanylate cyclase (GGDEF)-like protein